MSIPDIKFSSVVNPRLASLPDFTRDPRNFYKIQKALLETLHCHTSHSDPAEVFKCKKCTENMMERRKLMEKFGFKSPDQYMEWRREHEAVKRVLTKDAYDSIIDDKS